MAKKIKIVKIPKTLLPSDINEAWLGIKIRLYKEGESSYFVKANDAIEALKRAGKIEAAKFWVKIAKNAVISFRKGDCRVLHWHFF